MLFHFFPFLRLFGHKGYKNIGGGSGMSACSQNSFWQACANCNLTKKSALFKKDYGIKENLKKYSTELPSTYEIEKVSIPMD